MNEQRTISGWGLVATLFFFSIAAFVLLLGGGELVRMFVSGETATGTVTAKRRQMVAKNGSYNYHISYSFKVGDSDFTGTSAVDSSDFERLAQDSSLPVAYLPSNPRVNSFEDVLGTHFFIIFTVVGISGFAGLLSLFLTFRRRKPASRATRWS